MRAFAFLSTAALAAGIVIPDDAMVAQMAIGPTDALTETSADVSGWEAAVSAFDSLEPDTLQELMFGEDDGDEDRPPPPPHHPPPPPHHPHPPPHHPPHHGGGHHHKPNLTALQILEASNHTKIFAHLVTTYSSSLTSLLNATDKANYTVFAPLDKGFKKLHKHFKKHHPDGEKPKKPSNETIEKFLSYHVVEGKKPLHALFVLNTLPTLLDGGEDLGGPQRLRISPGVLGVHVNFFAKILWPNLPTSNGLIHFASFPLLPPPTLMHLISLLPTQFSTLSLALSKTGLDDTLSTLPKTGATFFAPTNRAFARLGPKVNAFLFNTDKGAKILKALLQYHFAPDLTLYTDAFYNPDSSSSSLPLAAARAGDELWADVRAAETELGEDAMAATWPGKATHVDLPSLLDDKPLGVDIHRGPLGTKMVVNRRFGIGMTDGLAKDGVFQFPRRVLMPPCPHKVPDDGDDEDEEMSVEELVARFGFGGEDGEGVDEL